MAWVRYVRWASQRPQTLRLAARLGRSRGRLRVFEGVTRPPLAPLKPDLAGWDDHDLAAAWLGHATVLLRLGGMTVLTDPVFSNRVGLGLGPVTGGPRRLVAPALSLRELPPIDLILVSHAHFDHLDRPSLDRLPKGAPVITSEHNADLIRDLGFGDVTELRWGETATRGTLKVTAQRVNHWGARTVSDRHRGFAGFLLESLTGDSRGRPRRVLYGGDTAYHDYFRGLGRVDLAILGIGAYDPWIESHANPEQALAMADHARAELILPMHHRTFRLSREPLDEPMQRLLAATNGDESRVAIRDVGGVWRG